MKSDKLVVNASPIISLAKIGCSDFLPGLFDQVVIPERVSDNIITAALQIAGEDSRL